MAFRQKKTREKHLDNRCAAKKENVKQIFSYYLLLLLIPTPQADPSAYKTPV
jgi:hypothetical protein